MATGTPLGRGDTDLDGRIRTLMPEGEPLVAGIYRMKFDTGRYFDSINVHAFYPEVVVVFEAATDEGHYHVSSLTRTLRLHHLQRNLTVRPVRIVPRVRTGASGASGAW